MAVVFIAASCGDKKNNAESGIAEVAKDSAAVDTTLYGTCGDGTSMNSLQLITDNGKTLEFTMQGEDTSSNVLGGLLSGDRLAVIACKTADGEMFAHGCHPVVADDYDFLGIVLHEYPYESVDERFAVDSYEWFRRFHAFLCKSRPLSGSYYCIFHILSDKSIQCKVIKFSYDKRTQ